MDEEKNLHFIPINHGLNIVIFSALRIIQKPYLSVIQTQIMGLVSIRLGILKYRVREVQYFHKVIIILLWNK